MDSRSPIPAIPAIPAIPPTTYQNLMNDVTVVKKYVHDRTDEEIFAYLEAHYNDFNRIERVVHELVGRNDIFIEENEIDKEENHKLEQIDLNNEQVQRLLGIKQCCWTQSCTCWTPRGNNGALPLIRRENSSISDENYKSYHDEQLKTLMEILPDGDSSFFSNFIRMNRGNETFINESVNLWLQKGNYKRRVEIQSEGVKKNRFVEGNMSVEEFLDIFPDPETFFDKARNTDVNKNYKHHVLIYTSNNYSLCDSYLVQIILKHKYRLIPVVEEMKCYEPAMKRIKKELREMPKEIDELFYQELTYLKLIDEIKGYRQRKDEEKRKRLEEAKSNGTLMTCECCFEEELLLDDMLPCPKDHLFCKICICRQAEINIGANKLQFPCFNGYCKEDFSMTVLQKCLKPNVFSIILRKVQEEEIRRAQIADLESCPFCSFSAIMPDPNDKVFKCLNPECLKSSCRLCKELNHVPLRCNEVEKKPEVDMRTFIENKMSDALMRTCPKCKCRLIKYEGCNRMTCTCGQMMCYLCRQPIDGYSHFESFGNSNSKCPITSNVFDLHQKELKSSAEAARREYIRLHPEVASMELKHDPIKHISNEHRLNLTKMTEFPVRRFDFTKIPIDSRGKATCIS
uniref:RING-type domain-containing protein n=1 Tax=Strigamia maritima TaxID=126957 RepID=T1J9J9_STRMM